MIAKNISQLPEQHCDEDTLRCLLDETLSETPRLAAESHLASCQQCLRRMEAMAGEQRWWKETSTIFLSEEHFANDSVVDAASSGASRGQENKPGDALRPTSDGQQAWLRSILRSDEEGHAKLGLLDRYRVDGIIGSGGMGVVLEAFDPQLNRPVAIKLLAPHLAGLGEARRRFTREARAAAAIVHPSIMPIYGVSDQSHPPYLVMPRISGGNLQDRIDQDGQLPLDEAISIAVQIAEGLAAAHERGVIHRDIKPGNILLEAQSPRILISDFGLARAIDGATVTVSGMVAGTPSYMSPEQAAGEKVDVQSDLFSLGSVLYAMLTARPPFVAEAPIAILRKVIDTTARPPSDHRESLPDWVDMLTMRFLTSDRSHRVANAAEAVAMLRQVESYLRNPTANSLPNTLVNRSRFTRRFAARPVAWLSAIALIAIGPFAATMWNPLDGNPSDQKASESGTAHVLAENLADDRHASEFPDATVNRSVAQANAMIDEGSGEPDNPELLPWDWTEFDSSTAEIRIELERLETIDTESLEMLP